MIYTLVLVFSLSGVTYAQVLSHGTDQQCLSAGREFLASKELADNSVLICTVLGDEV